MVAATAGATVVMWFVGVFLQSVVFDLVEGDPLTQAGAWGYVAAIALTVVWILPALAGILFGVRALRLGERRLGWIGTLANVAIVVYLVPTGIANLLVG